MFGCENSGGRDNLLGPLAPHADTHFLKEALRLLDRGDALFPHRESETELRAEKRERERQIFAITHQNVQRFESAGADRGGRAH